MVHVEQETSWDTPLGGTTWDRDYDGPGTRTRWDLIPAVIDATIRFVVRLPITRFVVKATRWRFKP